MWALSDVKEQVELYLAHPQQQQQQQYGVSVVSAGDRAWSQRRWAH